MRNAAFKPVRGNDVLALCHMFANRIGKVFASELAQYDITTAEWRVMMSLHEYMPGHEITGRWAMDKMAVNRAIASLVRRGLATKQRNKKDRRVVDLRLTKKGQALYGRLLPVAHDRYRKLMAGIGKADRAILRGMLIKLIAHADTIVD